MLMSSDGVADKEMLKTAHGKALMAKEAKAKAKPKVDMRNNPLFSKYYIENSSVADKV